MKTLKAIVLLIITANFSFSQINMDIEIEYNHPTIDTVSDTTFFSKLMLKT